MVVGRFRFRFCIVLILEIHDVNLKASLLPNRAGHVAFLLKRIYLQMRAAGFIPDLSPSIVLICDQAPS